MDFNGKHDFIIGMLWKLNFVTEAVWAVDIYGCTLEVAKIS